VGEEELKLALLLLVVEVAFGLELFAALELLVELELALSSEDEPALDKALDQALSR
jgi:hypothetical protein